MLANSQPLPRSEGERLDLATDQAIAACGGDMRSTIRSLIVANEFLEFEVREILSAVSAAQAGDSEMSKLTYFVALPFAAIDGGLAPGEAHICRTPSQALRLAEALALKEGNAGAVAFSRTGDVATGKFTDAKVIKAFGTVPPDLVPPINLDDVPDWYD